MSIINFPDRQSAEPTDPAAPLVVSKAKAAELLGVKPRTIQRYVAEGKLRAKGKNGGRRIVYASILDYLNSDNAA